MISRDGAVIKNCIVHKIGNKIEEGMHASHQNMSIREDMENVLLDYFFNAFKAKEYYNLSWDGDLIENPVYACASAIFDKPEYFYEESVKLAQYLYDQSEHPKIKSGKLFVVHFDNCFVDGQKLEAIGLFKVENQSNFLKFSLQDDNYGIMLDEGINLDKLDKGCFIFNSEREKGFWVAVSDSVKRSSDSHYWIDVFLHALQRQDEYYQTQNIMALCKNFITEKLPEEYDVTKADQAAILSKSVKFFKEKDTFDFDDFAQEILPDKQVVESFRNYKEQLNDEMEMKIEDNFVISESAVKKQSKDFKSVIKLDKNFHVYVHGDTKFIEKGFDEEVNLRYYRLYFREEQ